MIRTGSQNTDDQECTDYNKSMPLTGITHSKTSWYASLRTSTKINTWKYLQIEAVFQFSEFSKSSFTDSDNACFPSV